MTKDVRVKGKYSLIWISDAQQNDESDIINRLSPNSKIHQTSIYQAGERKLNVSKSISYKRKHSNNDTSTNLHKPVQVKIVKDNV